jgi:erythromycin esterase-like protein
MWANTEVADFAAWLRDFNTALAAGARVGFHGLDVYSLWDSLRNVLDYLADNEPELVDVARDAFRCFLPYRDDPQSYAWATRYLPDNCEEAVVQLLTELCQTTAGGDADRFDAEQNAAVAAGAERYYRAMVRGGPDSWNVRDTHMADTIDRLVQRYGPGCRGVVWEHNTHIGDARYTDMASAGMVNVGQLARERYGADNVVLVGFAGYTGSVIAAPAWGAQPQRMSVPPAPSGTLERLLQEADIGDSLFVMDDADQAWTAERLDHRAIGVVYDPAREQWRNYVPTVTGRRYDALLWLPATEALVPLGSEPPPPMGEPETYPSGM